MSEEQEIDLTDTLTRALAADDQETAEQLMLAVYDQLRGLAGSMLRQEVPGHTLQPTALVNEAYMKLVDQTRVDWQGRTHFFAVGAKMMRRILVDHARKKKRVKRGGGIHRVSLSDDVQVSKNNDEDVLAIEEALEKLAEQDPRQAQIVELRFYGGLTVAEVAQVLHVSKRTIESEWTILKAWLRRELSGESTT
ncbi:MAG: sigma-70 family RNA polymerase sigma factor [Rubripirellula sp.]|nr:sigma-70 family RNA polymerase sigma factor [Rubripirellula sp.]